MLQSKVIQRALFVLLGACLLMPGAAWSWQDIARPAKRGARADAGVADAAPRARPPVPSPPPPAPPPAPTAVPEDDGFPTKKMGTLVLKMPPTLAEGTHVHGYAFHRFQVTNKGSSAESVRVRLVGKAADGFHLKEVSQTRRIPAGERVWFQLRYPRLTFEGRVVEVWKGGSMVGRVRLNEAYPTLHKHRFRQIQVLRSRRISRSLSRQLRRGLQQLKRFNTHTRRRVMRRHRYRLYRHRYRRHWRWMYRRRRLHGGIAPKPPPPPRLSAEVRKLLRIPQQLFFNNTFLWHRAQVDTRHWPAHWLAYSRFDGIMLDPKEWKSLRDGAQVALYRYAEAGGTLVLTGAWQAPSTWSPGEYSNATWRIYERGFGRVIVYKSGLPLDTRNDASILVPLYKSFAHSFAAWQEVLTPHRANEFFSVVGNLKIPARGIFALMFLFVVLIGPLNFWLLGRMEKRLWTLWTVPLIAFVTCAMLFFYASFSEGWGGHARLASLTLLDQSSKRATTLGWIGFYKPLTPSNGLRFDLDTELVPQLANDGRANRGLVMDLSSAQQLSKGWSLSRLPLHFRFRRSERRQERLVVKPKGKSVEVLNGFGVPISRLWLVDAKGHRFTGKNIASGARIDLVRYAGSLDGVDNKYLRTLYTKSWRRLYSSLLQRPWGYLQRGRYIAEIETSPFVDPAVKSSSYIRSKSLVYGILGAPNGN